MTRRLVLGCGTAARRSIERMAEWPGELVVLSQRGGVVESFREDGVVVDRRAPDDAEAYPDHADVVFVASDDAETNVEAARLVRENYPDAYVVGYLGQDAAHDVQRTLTSLVDRTVDGRAVLFDRLMNLAGGQSADRLHRLYRVLRSIEGRLAVVMHDNPDPDAIASAIALCRIAETVGVPADPCYFGEISHQENRAFVNLLDLDLTQLDPGATVSAYDGIALVDHSRPGVNDGLSPDVDVDIVIDHHPPRAPVEGRFLDLRRAMGSTSTLLVDYLERLNVDPDETVATALLFGIRVDTRDFTREVSPADFEAAAFCLPAADLSLLQRVESPSMSSEVLETVARAVRNRDVRGEALATNVGEIRDRDALAQAADRLLGMDGVKIVVVYGFKDGTVFVSARARGTEVDLGETLRDALGPIGSAGGHADMAGAQIPLGILADVGEDSRESLERVVSDVIAGRFFETLEDATMMLTHDEDGTDLTFEFPMDEW
ncbi:nanoRNase/pAp phosphatase, hydrolyzes c-di-AMP and oligoRNAs [Halopelagius inordinatus]|uniref:NanoRNase/pAp phosphatase, hydrolyzes c-di-AMP and oligoRNAs n=1 Tax=Halopelagius inordinatus TaxID=553467 RepID=A0A1I2NHL3_9EURY|nr:DHH family phosphoesterase [Halopelagius inordinatus]SFG03404.1 nanoRNase/pAp phosphatase, hydrolyzes c-di-AMP and oligoRNAs [Halopelagius inordinatus]